MRLPTLRTQRGFTLIELSIITAILLGLTVAGVKVLTAWINDMNARAAGVRVAQYNSAVASFINAAGAAVPFGNYNGIGWLQSAATCAGATGPDDFLPCGFYPALPWNLQYNTTIAQNGVGRVQAITTLGTPTMGAGGGPLMNFGAALIRSAQAYVGISQLRAQNLVGITSYNIDLNTNTLFAQVDTAVNVDPWLRIDGSNSMQANLNVGGNDVVNARDLNASRDVNATNNVQAASGRAVLWNNPAEGGVITLTGANGQRVFIENLNGTFRLINHPWNAELMRTDQGGNLSAGRDVAANMNGWGGDVKVANTNNGFGPMSVSGALQGAQILNNPGWFPKPTNCPPGTTPKIFATAVQIDNNGTAEPIGALQTLATDQGAGWSLSTKITTPSGQPKPSVVRILAMTACQP
jgi:type II secretory pathway pseudopilin PulG